MAARLNNRHKEQSLKAIQTTQLLKRLNKQALGEIKMDANQIRATEILLRKTIPDLKSMEMVDNTPKSVTFNFFGEQPNVPQPIQASVVDAKPIEYDDKGDTKIVDDSVTESLPVSK